MNKRRGRPQGAVIVPCAGKNGGKARFLCSDHGDGTCRFQLSAICISHDVNVASGMLEVMSLHLFSPQDAPCHPFVEILSRRPVEHA